METGITLGKEWLTTKEAATLLKVNYRHINRLVREGKLKTMGPVKKWEAQLVSAAQVLALWNDPEQQRRPGQPENGWASRRYLVRSEWEEARHIL